MTQAITAKRPATLERASRFFLMLWRDKFAFVSFCFLLVLLFCAFFGPVLLREEATIINLTARNKPPFSFECGWLCTLGTDSLGRSIIARIIVGSSNTLSVAASAVALALCIGCFFGLIAGYVGGRVSHLIMRLADVVMSFPSLLLALIVLYSLGPSIFNVVLVLAITRIPLYLRTSRAEVLEIRERMFVVAAKVLGARAPRLIAYHVAPMTVPTLITIATIDMAGVMLSESSLSFLGLGIQAPEISWGLMVAEGQAYLTSAWWLSFWPGLAIALTALSLNLLASWLRVVIDPKQRWRVERRTTTEALRA